VVRVYRWLIGVSLLPLAWISGCFPTCGATKYGVSTQYVTAYGTRVPISASQVTIKQFSYTPLGTVHPGDELVFSVELDHPASGRVSVKISGKHELFLRDDGQAPDTTAGDGIYRGSLRWTSRLGRSGTYLPVAYVSWPKARISQLRQGPPFNVEPK
jgi:hypothetical protein